MVSTELDELRKRIDHLDEKILALLAARIAISRQIGDLKTGVKIDPKREENIIERLTSITPSKEVDRTAIEQIWGEIFKQSRRAQKD